MILDLLGEMITFAFKDLSPVAKGPKKDRIKKVKIQSSYIFNFSFLFLQFVCTGDDELSGLVLLHPDQLLHALVRLHGVQVPPTQQVHFALHLQNKNENILKLLDLIWTGPFINDVS